MNPFGKRASFVKHHPRDLDGTKPGGDWCFADGHLKRGKVRGGTLRPRLQKLSEKEEAAVPMSPRRWNARAVWGLVKGKEVEKWGK